MKRKSILLPFEKATARQLEVIARYEDCPKQLKTAACATSKRGEALSDDSCRERIFDRVVESYKRGLWAGILRETD